MDSLLLGTPTPTPRTMLAVSLTRTPLILNLMRAGLAIMPSHIWLLLEFAIPRTALRNGAKAGGVVGRLHVGCRCRPEGWVHIVVLLLPAVQCECCVVDDETDDYEGDGEEPMRDFISIHDFVSLFRGDDDLHGFQADGLNEAVEDLGESVGTESRPLHCARVAVHA